ncbi:NIPSNAP family protein [Pseudomonas vanderleydeniana]|uniref:NIPSNAP family protein n=1 Tax=Pseudomonas vanderleydeniana TaxID=2745495 RepID=A0A9E6PQM7_9PSED|nr:NIPSNAP family protein [Pseudomonas vanderleydeniana]QXI30921.1 NIPSNAP family protein [Pseudomonas vanderleydeniana]
MIDELRQYTFTAESWERYWKLFNNLCMPIRGNDFGSLQGLWLEQVGSTVTFRHVWRYESLDARARLRAELLKVDDWREKFLPQAACHVADQHLQVLIPRAEGEGLEVAAARYLHVYRCSTGKAAGIIQQINGVASSARKNLCGLWATEFPNPNQIVAMTSSEEAPLLALNTEVEIETRLLKPLDCRSDPSVA